MLYKVTARPFWHEEAERLKKRNIHIYAFSVQVWYGNVTHTRQDRDTDEAGSWHSWGRIVTQLRQDRDTVEAGSWHSWGRIVTRMRQDRDTDEAGSWHRCEKIVTRLRQDRYTARRRWQNSEITLSIYLYKVAAQPFWHEGSDRLKNSRSLTWAFPLR